MPIKKKEKQMFDQYLHMNFLLLKFYQNITKLTENNGKTFLHALLKNLNYFIIIQLKLSVFSPHLSPASLDSFINN